MCCRASNSWEIKATCGLSFKQVTKHSQKLQKTTGDPLTCIETAEGKNSHILETCGRQGLQHGQGQSIQSHGDIDHQRVEPAGRTHAEHWPGTATSPRHTGCPRQGWHWPVAHGRGVGHGGRHDEEGVGGHGVLEAVDVAQEVRQVQAHAQQLLGATCQPQQQGCVTASP